MNKVFLYSGESQKTYLDLLNDINSINSFSPIISEADVYMFYVKLLHSIVMGQKVIVLDSDLSQSEKESLANEIETNISSSNYKVNLESTEELRDKINDYNSTWSIDLFTSGTTGQPKKIEHKLSTLNKTVKVSSKHTDSIWALCYNPTHIAGIQVFFQAVSNLNTIVHLFSESSQHVAAEIAAKNISHISATPTFYNLLPRARIYPSVKRITFGGEKFREENKDRIAKMFPNARVNNVYASTEIGSLIASKNNAFTVTDELRHRVKIEDNELLIHKSLCSITIQNREEEWFRTGDLVTIIKEDPLTFTISSRKNEMINIGGMKVNPHEVEAVINSLESITQSFVYAKPNKLLGNILVAEVQVEKPVLEKDIRNQLSTVLQEYKIPRIIKFVDEIALTRTGKIKR